MKAYVVFLICAISVLAVQCAGASKLGVVEDVVTSPPVAKAVKSNSKVLVKIGKMAFEGMHKFAPIVLIVYLGNRRKRGETSDGAVFGALFAGAWAAWGWLGWPMVTTSQATGWWLWASEKVETEFSLMRLGGTIFVAFIAVVAMEMIGQAGGEICEETVADGGEVLDSVMRDDDTL